MDDICDTEIERAISIVGSQEALGAAINCAQQTVSKLLRRQRRITAEQAVAIERATGGEVRAHQLRPDLDWLKALPPPLPTQPQPEPAEGVEG